MVSILLIIILDLEVLERNMGDVNTKDRTLFDFFYRTKWQSKSEIIILEVSWNQMLEKQKKEKSPTTLLFSFLCSTYHS